MRTVEAWKPARRTRRCGGPDCTQREALRTNAITVNGEPISMCWRCWKGYTAQLPNPVVMLPDPPPRRGRACPTHGWVTCRTKASDSSRWACPKCGQGALTEAEWSALSFERNKRRVTGGA